MTEVCLEDEVSDYDDVLKMASLIEKNKNEQVIIVNYIQLQKPSKDILKKIKP
jgi:hypothetical protein